MTNETISTARGGPATSSLAAYVAAVELEGDRFARLAEQGRLDVRVPACPDWDLRDLVRHVGVIHLWAAANVAYPKPEWLTVDDITDLADHWPDLASRWPSDDDLVPWYRATVANLVDVLRTAPPDVSACVFLRAPSPLVMWARRQASELAIHRFDAEAALGLESHFAPEFAGDMLDELFGFAPLYPEVRTSQKRTLRVVASDVGEHWWVTMDPSRMRVSRNGADADLTVTGTAADLYLALWNRTTGEDLELAGDPEVLDVWRDSCRVVWNG